MRVLVPITGPREAVNGFQLLRACRWLHGSSTGTEFKCRKQLPSNGITCRCGWDARQVVEVTGGPYTSNHSNVRRSGSYLSRYMAASSDLERLNENLQSGFQTGESYIRKHLQAQKRCL